LSDICGTLVLFFGGYLPKTIQQTYLENATIFTRHMWIG